MSEVYEEALFRCTHDALVFAFNYQGQQGPRSTMFVPPTGTGKGLSGVDGAAQAGFILAAVQRLSREERNVITARFGNVQHDCPCCGQPTAGDDWRQAVTSLSLCDELKDLPRNARLAVIQGALKLRHWNIPTLSRDFGISERTLRHKTKEVREKLFKCERKALIQLDSLFSAVGLISPIAYT